MKIKKTNFLRVGIRDQKPINVLRTKYNIMNLKKKLLFTYDNSDFGRCTITSTSRVHDTCTNNE